MLRISTFALALLLTSCVEEDLEKAQFNAYFYYPLTTSPSKEEYLGQVVGISACQNAAGARARSLNMSPSSQWSYICCKKTSQSECETKHK